MVFSGRYISRVGFVNADNSCFRYLAAGVLALASLNGVCAELKFDGASHSVFSEKGESSTGLEYIYVLYDLDGVTGQYERQSLTTDAKVYRFSMLGGGYAEEITDVRNDGKNILFPMSQGDMGYIIEENDRRYCFWVIDYSLHRAELLSLQVAADGLECSSTELLFNGSADAIHYYTINGRQQVLSRELILSYDNQVWHDDNDSGHGEGFGEYVTEKVSSVLESCKESIMVSPPNYCTSSFSLSGDRFLKFWGEERSVSTDFVTPVAAEVHTAAEQPKGEETEEGSNMLRPEGDGLGGSAPADIDFYAWVTEGVLFQEWQISSDPEFGIIDFRFPQLELNHTFREEGTWYVRFVGANADGSCDAYGDVYTINIGASELLCPNAFSPDGDGVNDVWKVSYRSLLEFECFIFDRYGVQMAHFTDPESGWDGKYGGKTVRSGVYYYVINAVGADGKKYKKSGDINIIRHKTYSGGGASEDTVE